MDSHGEGISACRDGILLEDQKILSQSSTDKVGFFQVPLHDSLAATLD